MAEQFFRLIFQLFVIFSLINSRNDVYSSPVPPRSNSKTPTTTFSSLFYHAISPQIETLIQNIFLYTETPIISDFSLSTHQGNLKVKVVFKSETFQKLLLNIIHVDPISFIIRFHDEEWIKCQVNLKATRGNKIQIILHLGLNNMRELEDAFEGASNLLWSNADHHSSEVSSLFSISVTNIVLGDWEICNRSCIQILMNQWYDVYQSLREKNKIKKSHEELETKKETSFLNGIIENVEGTLKSAYSSAMYLASNFDEIYQTARQFIFENSVLVPVTFPFPIHLHPSAKVGVYFWIKSKNKKAHTFIHIDSIEKAVLKNGQDALKITFNSKSKSIPMLVKGILFHEIEQINHVVFKIDDKKFTFLRRVQIEV